MDDIDSQVESVNEWEEKQRASSNPAPATVQSNKVLVGTVEQFFDKISVVAISLTGELKVGDIIEIGNEEEAVRQRVFSMQIDREDVSEAQEGSSIGIKLKYPVPVGSEVYRIR